MEVSEKQSLKISDKYEPLFEWFSVEDESDPLYKVDTIIVIGGRNSQKSFAVGTGTCIAAKDFILSVLYTRYSMRATEDSIIPEFNEKIEILNCETSFNVLKDRVITKDGKAKIVLKGKESLLESS
ncbi:hypothetical protein [Sphingobacterium hotanense]|uniref:hypothetical protein n=1 Tax=Sphingobacterium hotanense TaxID=649196 RepID=UPI0011F2F058|nr:hypothetical protein [Sphingobacterium hotanense]